MKNKNEFYEKIILIVKDLGVVTIKDIQKGLNRHYQTAVRALMEMEIKGLLKHRIIMTRGGNDYKVWVLNKLKETEKNE